MKPVTCYLLPRFVCMILVDWLCGDSVPPCLLFRLSRIGFPLRKPAQPPRRGNVSKAGVKYMQCMHANCTVEL